MDTTGPVVVLVSWPKDPGPDLVGRLTAASPSVDVRAVAYEGEVTDEVRAAYADADALLAFSLPDELADLAPRLRWVQAIGAGVDHFRNARMPDGVVVTNAVGIAAGPIAEFVIARLLAMWKRFDHLADLQRRREWELAFGRRLEGSTIGIGGLGAIGTAVAERARALGMRVLAVRRSGGASPVADEVVGP